MGKYNIVSKKPSGNKVHQVYEIEYQVNNQPERYIAKMVLVDVNKDGLSFAFLGEQILKGIDNPEDRRNFISEIIQFQKGSSYRKKNPISYNIIEEIENKIEKLKQKLDKMLKEENKKND